jgi:hypothetical protein
MTRFLSLLLLLTLIPAVAADDTAVKGQRVFSAGHSFHMPMPGPLEQIAKQAKVDGHKIAGTQGLGGSSVTQHWNLPDDKDKARKALKTGDVDVLTLSPHLNMPDDAIDKFTALMLEHNPKGRVLIQMSWFPYDTLPEMGKKFENANRDDNKPDELRKGIWNVWLMKFREQTKKLNETHKKQVVFVVPVGEAVLKLRERVIKGEVPGYAKQSDLFTDAIGHGKAPISWLTAYCHFAVIYGKSPVGLPVPDAFKKEKDAEKLVKELQEAAWAAVIEEPFSGLKGK